jgi:hypothetical protein
MQKETSTLFQNRKLMKMKSVKVNLMFSVSLLCSILLLLVVDIFVAEEEEVNPSVPCLMVRKDDCSAIS